MRGLLPDANQQSVSNTEAEKSRLIRESGFKNKKKSDSSSCRIRKSPINLYNIRNSLFSKYLERIRVTCALALAYSG
jgi:hypothetical protein